MDLEDSVSHILLLHSSPQPQHEGKEGKEEGKKEGRKGDHWFPERFLG